MTTKTEKFIVEITSPDDTVIDVDAIQEDVFNGLGFEECLVNVYKMDGE